MKPRRLAIQFHLKRAQEVSALEFKTLVSDFARKNGLRISVSEGFDNGRYINVMIRSLNLPKIWRNLERTLFAGAKRGAVVRASTIVTCQGEHGWDDYLLLYHFDRRIKLDKVKIKPVSGPKAARTRKRASGKG